MKDLINSWENSDKYKEFKYKLDNKRKDMRQNALTLNIKLKDMEDFVVLSKKELEVLLDNIILSEEEGSQDSTQWISTLLCEANTKDDLFVEYINNLTRWFVYIGVYQKLEDYELCGKLVKVIDIETEELRDLFKVKYETITDDEEEYIENILESFRKQIQK